MCERHLLFMQRARSNNGMQRTALRATADAERYTAVTRIS